MLGKFSLTRFFVVAAERRNLVLFAVVVYTLANIMGNGHVAVAWVHDVLRDTLSNQNTNQWALCCFVFFSVLFIYCACNGKKAAKRCTVNFVCASNWTFWQLCGVRLRNSNLLKTVDILLFKYHGMWISSLRTRLRSAAVYLLFHRIIVFVQFFWYWIGLKCFFISHAHSILRHVILTHFANRYNECNEIL